MIVQQKKMLKSNAVGKQYFRVEIPNDYRVLESITTAQSKTGGWSYAHHPHILSYALPEHLVRELGEVFGHPLPPMDIDADSITTTPALVEWLLERMGYHYAVRLTKDFGWRTDLAQEILDIGEAEMLIYPQHICLRTTDPVTQSLLEIRFAEYRVAHDSRASISDIVQMMST